jgi:hypothetical protein
MKGEKDMTKKKEPEQARQKTFHYEGDSPAGARRIADRERKQAKLTIKIADIIQATFGKDSPGYGEAVLMGVRHVLRGREIQATADGPTPS